ncbi:hypothetical protein BGZ73_007761, partial [Actinomortierella ambigua]
MKITLLLSALCIAQAALAEAYSLHISNNDASKDFTFEFDDDRICYCLKDTQTAKIDGRNGGDVKLFSSNNCKGDYTSGSGKVTYGAQWVNSVSFGKSGIASRGPGKSCKCGRKIGMNGLDQLELKQYLETSQPLTHLITEYTTTGELRM